MRENHYRIITRVIACIVLFRCISDLAILMDYKQYEFMFQFYSENKIATRYFFSVTLRIILVICTFGIFFFQNIFRQVLLLLYFATLVTLFWKHPYQAFVNYDIYNNIGPDVYYKSMHQFIGESPVKYETTKRFNQISVILTDMALSITLLIWFTRQKVAVLFTGFSMSNILQSIIKHKSQKPS